MVHRDDGHAVEHPDGSKEWRKNDLLHRKDGPAIETVDGEREWYLNGLRHRLDGPAIERKNCKAWQMALKCGMFSGKESIEMDSVNFEKFK